jgi:hypothetical protein
MNANVMERERETNQILSSSFNHHTDNNVVIDVLAMIELLTIWT